MGNAIIKKAEEFVDNYMENGTYAKRELIEEIIGTVVTLITNNPHATPEEHISLLLADVAAEISNIKKSTITPGMVVKVTAGNLEGIVCDGYTSTDSGILVTENTLFDQASVTKDFTSIVMYNLINEGVFNFDTKIKDLDSRFVNMEDLTIEEVLGFTVSFRTPGRVDDVEYSSDAYDRFINMTFDKESRGNYNYNDLGMMMLKEVMETVTGKTYAKLVKEYILDKANIKDIYTSLPEDRINDFTGSANQELGMGNDPKHIILNGKESHGHAGVIGSVKAMGEHGAINRGKDNIVPANKIIDSYTLGAKNRGVAGHTYPAMPGGLEKGGIDVSYSTKSYGCQGFTRVDHGNNCTYDCGYSIHANPASANKNDIAALEKITNEQRAMKGLNPFVFLKNYTVDGSTYSLVDSTKIIPLAKYDPMIEKCARTSIKLAFLGEFIKENASAKIQQDTKCLVKF